MAIFKNQLKETTIQSMTTAYYHTLFRGSHFDD